MEARVIMADLPPIGAQVCRISLDDLADQAAKGEVILLAAGSEPVLDWLAQKVPVARLNSVPAGLDAAYYIVSVRGVAALFRRV